MLSELYDIDVLRVSLRWMEVAPEHRHGIPADDIPRVNLTDRAGTTVAALLPADAQQLAQAILTAADTGEGAAWGQASNVAAIRAQSR